MEYSLKHLPKSTVQLTITVPSDKMPEYQRKATEEISRDIEIKGFRKGHVPPHILEQYVKKEYIESHAQEMAIRQAYAEIVVKEKLQVVTRPEVKIEKHDPLTFIATVAVMPAVEIKDYKSIKVKKDQVAVTEKDLEDVIKDIKKYGTIYRDVDREIKKGDRIELDFEGFDDKDQPVPNTKSTNHPLIVGDGTLVPGFEENLIGLKKTGKKEFTVTFPKDYGKKDFQGRKLKFKVEIKRIEEPSVPDLDEALIERATGHKHTVEEFKKEVSANILAKKEEEAKIKQENEYIEKLVKAMKVEIPEVMIEEEARYILSEVKEDTGKKGIEFTKFLEVAKTTEEELIKKYREEGERRVKIRLAMQFLLKAEDIKATEEEIKTEFEKIKAMYPENQYKKIEADFAGGSLSNQITNRLIVKKLFEKVLVH